MCDVLSQNFDIEKRRLAKRKEYRKAYYDRNKEKLKAETRLYYLNNPELCKANTKRWVNKNKQHVLNKLKDRYHNDPEHRKYKELKRKQRVLERKIGNMNPLEREIYLDANDMFLL